MQKDNNLNIYWNISNFTFCMLFVLMYQLYQLESTVSIHMHIWFQNIKKCITHLCMHTSQTQKFMGLAETSTFGIFRGRNVRGWNVQAETS